MATSSHNQRFSQVFDSIAPRYNQISNSYTTSRRIEFFLKNAHGKCLEVGAATGEISKALSKRFTVVATDISPKMVDQINNDSKYKIKAVVCDAEKLPFADASFDTIISAEVIYYLEHPEKFVNEAFRVLKPGGKLLISSASDVTVVYDRIRALLRNLGFGSMYFDDGNRGFMSLSQLETLVGKKFSIEEEERAVLLPFNGLDWLNRLLERTPLNRAAVFIYLKAKKNEK